MSLENLFATFSPDDSAVREHNACPPSLGFGEIHKAIILNAKPSRALIIGSRYGYIPAVIATVAKCYNLPLVIDFVDANYHDKIEGFLRAFGGVGAWKTPSVRFELLDLQDYINCYIMPTSQFFPTCSHTYGYIYFDGDHSYKGVTYDFTYALSHSSQETWFAFHDVLVTEPAFGVRQFYEELPLSIYEKLTIPFWPGLGIVRKK